MSHQHTKFHIPINIMDAALLALILGVALLLILNLAVITLDDGGRLPKAVHAAPLLDKKPESSVKDSSAGDPVEPLAQNTRPDSTQVAQ
jgi:hypothetical protein